MSIVDDILNLFSAAGHNVYLGEAVTQLEHALQAAHLAERACAEAPTVAAALLHDVGHLLSLHPGMDPLTAELDCDARHEVLGAVWLARYFGAAVTDPIRLHVPAKRYLCTVEPAYWATLSPTSQHTLKLQGGLLDADGVARFEQEPHAQAAVLVRRWDDAAKIPGMKVPDLEHYRPLLGAVLAGQ